MSDIQRWGSRLDGGTGALHLSVMSNGMYILHADIVKVFAWMVEHRVACHSTWFSWRDNGVWNAQDAPGGDFLGAITGLMGGDDE